MLKLTMPEEVAEYKTRCERFITDAPTIENALYWKERANECETLLTLFKEMKMCWSDWAKMKQIAELNREERTMAI